jgi:hypothetical protein
MLNPINLAGALVLAIILGSIWRLDGPSDIDVIQAIATNKQALQTDKLVLP